MNRDEGIAEWTGGRKIRERNGYERKRSIEMRGEGQRERGRKREGRGRRGEGGRRMKRRVSASNADIRHTTSNAGAARWRLDRPTLKTPVDQP